jgi:hypothetical protein
MNKFFLFISIKNRDMSSLYDANVSLNSDSCWMNAKDNYNNNVGKYSLYYNDTAKENKQTGTLPDMANDHINLRGRPGYGLADDYLIDIYSALRNDPNAMTRDRCSIQLITRTFAGGPKLTGKSGDINKELDVLSGSDTRALPALSNADENVSMPYRCNKSIMEITTNEFMPMLDCMKEVQKPQHIIPDWTRGGEDSRSYKNKAKFASCMRK